MASKKIILEFRANPSAGSSITYKIYVNGSQLAYNNSYNLINLAFTSGSNSISPQLIQIGVDLDSTVTNVLNWFNSYNFILNGFVGGFSTQVSYAKVSNTIEITITSTSEESQITLFDVTSSNQNVIIRPENPCTYAFISNQSLPTLYDDIFALTSGTYFLFNQTLGVTSVPQSIKNAFDLKLIRGHVYFLTRLSDSYQISFSVYQSITDANVNAYFISNQLTIDIVGLTGFVSTNFAYSIDGITYQSSNLFPDLDIGNYTFYVRDSLGCVKSYDIENVGQTNLNTVASFVYISETNSIRFVESVDHQNCGNYKNVFNTLSCQEDTTPAFDYTQLFQACDINNRTQILTSYQNIEAFGVELNGTQTELTPQKIVNNIGLEDKRDCTYYTYNNKLAVYFTTGNTYDYGTTDINGTYALNGQLPEFGEIGYWVETPYGVMQITSIRIANDGVRSLILSSNIAISGILNSTIQTIYNRESYDIWELPINMNDFNNKTFQIILRFYQTEVDENFPDKFYISEKIQVKTRHPRSKEIIYKNSKNTDIYFYSGIEMKLRLNHCDVNGQLSDGSVELQKKDSQIISIDAVDYDAVEFKALFLTTGMMRKLKKALKHDFLLLENVPYKLAGDIDIKRHGISNFYDVIAKLYETGDIWNQGTANTQTIYTGVELIGLLQVDAEDEYIRII